MARMRAAGLLTCLNVGAAAAPAKLSAAEIAPYPPMQVSAARGMQSRLLSLRLSLCEFTSLLCRCLFLDIAVALVGVVHARRPRDGGQHER
eukprot:COSAG03_NODE_516_length_7263_cov_69.317884_1_plen_90_part_10